jgi:hypothetical protein
MTLAQVIGGTLVVGIVGSIIVFVALNARHAVRAKTIAACQEETSKAYSNVKPYIAGQHFMTCMKAKGFAWGCERMPEDLAGFFFIGFVRFKGASDRPKDVQFHQQLIECFR